MACFARSPSAPQAMSGRRRHCDRGTVFRRKRRTPRLGHIHAVRSFGPSSTPRIEHVTQHRLVLRGAQSLPLPGFSVHVSSDMFGGTGRKCLHFDEPMALSARGPKLPQNLPHGRNSGAMRKTAPTRRFTFRLHIFSLMEFYSLDAGRGPRAPRGCRVDGAGALSRARRGLGVSGRPLSSLLSSLSSRRLISSHDAGASTAPRRRVGRVRDNHLTPIEPLESGCSSRETLMLTLIILGWLASARRRALPAST